MTNDDFPHIEPLPEFFRDPSRPRRKIFAPMPPPIWPPGYEPTPADIQLVLDLIAELDEDSRHRYQHIVARYTGQTD
jgi:hypothetical protein